MASRFTDEELEKMGVVRISETVEKRALKIAAVILKRLDCCKFEDNMQCDFRSAEEEHCSECIVDWLLNKAKKELERERRRD